MFALSCLSLKTSMTLAMIPVFIIAVRSMGAYASRQFQTSALFQRSIGRIVAMIQAKGPALEQATTFAEIGLGFYLLALLITPRRNILLLFFYWNMLKTRYIAPDSSRRVELLVQS